MTKKILALSVSVLMVMSMLCALPVSATVTLPENIGTDYEYTDVLEGNLFTDLDTVSGYTPTYSHSTANTCHDKALIHQGIVLEDETLDTESALYKSGDVSFSNWTTGNGFTLESNRKVLDPWSVYTDDDSDGVYTLDESTQDYKYALAGAKLKVVDVSTDGDTLTTTNKIFPTPEYTRNVVVRVPLSIKSGTGTAKMNIARSKYQSEAMGGPNYYSHTGNAASDHEYPIEYNGSDQGVTVAADGTTYLNATFAGGTAAEDPRYSYTLGMAEGTDAGITVFVSDVDFYIGYEYAKDLIVDASNTGISSETPIVVTSEVLNQVGNQGGLSQNVTWYALNAARDTAVDGFTFTEKADGTTEVTVDSAVTAGTYALVAVSDEYSELVKGVSVNVTNINLSEDYVPGEIEGNRYVAPDSGSEAGNSLNVNESRVTFSANSVGDLVFANSQVLGDGIEAQSAHQAFGAAVNKNYWDWNTLHVNGEKFIVGAQVKAIAGTPKFTAAFFEQNRIGDRPDGFSVSDGVPITWTEYAPVCVHMTMTQARNLSENMAYSSFAIGMPEDPAGTTEVEERSFAMKPGSLFIGYEAPYDIKVSGGGEISQFAPATVNADILNQLGSEGYLSQDVTWFAMNEARTEKVAGFTITEKGDGTATVSVDSTVAVGNYALVAVADENLALVKGVPVSVYSLTQDYVAGDVTGDLLPDEAETWSNDGSTTMQVGTKSDTGEWYALYTSNHTNVGDNTYGVSGSPIYLGNTSGGYTNLRKLASDGEIGAGSHIVFGALVNGLYDTPTISATMRGNTGDTVYPKEYAAGEGMSPAYGKYQQFGVTFELDENTKHPWHMSMRMGFVKGSTTENSAGEAFVMKKGSMYLGVEYAYDMNLAVVGETSFEEGAGGSFMTRAEVLNQVGSTGYLSQDVTWYALNESRTEIVDGITVAPGENGTAIVAIDANMPKGTYKLVAVADEYTNIVKSVEIKIGTEEPVIEDITIAETEGGITVSTDEDLTNAQLIFVTYEDGKMVSVNNETTVTLAAQGTQEYAIPSGFETAKVMLWSSDFKPLANVLN